MSAAEIAQQLEVGQAFHRAGRLGLAESHYQRVVKLDPTHAEAWHLLGVVAFQAGQAPKAVKHYRRALSVRPRFAQAWNNLALALAAQGQQAAARDAYREALAIRPEYVEAGFNLALAEAALGNLAAAEAAYRQVLAWSPDALPVLTNLGNLLRQADRAFEALPLLQRAHQLAGDAASACNLAFALIDVGRYDEARALAESATRRSPDDAGTWSTLGTTARLAGDPDVAMTAFERATTLAHDDFASWHELAQLHEGAGDHEGAAAAYARANALAPQDERLRWAAALSVPALPASDAAIDATIAGFTAGVARIVASPARDPKAALAAAASVTPFALHYLPRDTTAACNAFGDLVQRTVMRAMPDFAAPPARRVRDGADGRARVGFVGSHFIAHTVSRYFGEMIRRLDATRFETQLFFTGERADAETERYAAAAARFVHHTGDLDALARRLRDAELDVLVYTDIGMDPRMHVLAAARLAPAQALLYGHPASSGLATVDACFSGAALEPANPQAHYRERVVLLPGLGAALSPPDVTPDRDWFDAFRDGAAPIAVCAQNIAKLVPAFDEALARIVAATGARVAVFDRHRALTQRWLARAAPAWQRHGVDVAHHVLALPPQPYPRFLGALAGADLVLDTPWFSGGATSVDALAVGAPLLAWEGRFARGRQSAAMLGLLGLDELVARDAETYVARATGLLRDPVAVASLRTRIAAAAPRLFDYDAVHAAFADALQSLAER